MYQGEIYAYPLTLQWVISQDYSTMKFICQDVICKYFPWMMKVLDKPINIPGIDALRQCKPFLSVMHGKAHNWSCQVCNDCLFCLIFSHVFLWDGGEKSERVSYFCFDRKGYKIIDKMGRKMAVWIRLCITGEEMEQCNSYLSTAGLTTKNMSKSGKFFIIKTSKW